jgi:SRSO17 transposase
MVVSVEGADGCLVRAREIGECTGRLALFADRYKPLMVRSEQRQHLGVYLEGLVSGLERKSIEPIATAHGLYRRPLQRFVGAGRWDDGAFLEELRIHVGEEIGERDGVLIIDGSGFEKSGPESVGVDRQWCGRLGKVENCQVGVFLGYSTRGGQALVDAQLYLPESWANDRERRAAAYVPEELKFLKNWQLADALLRRSGDSLPHAWVVGDDEFGRPTEFRDRLADREERYLLEVPSNTLVRRPSNWPGRRRKWSQVAERKRTRSPKGWRRMTLREGERGPIEVLAFSTRVETKRTGQAPRKEILLVMTTISGDKTWYFLAPPSAPLKTKKLVWVASHRNDIEQLFQAAKGEVGLDHYEVRSWIGWHHHVALSMIALWFLALERRRLGKKLLQ